MAWPLKAWQSEPGSNGFVSRPGLLCLSVIRSMVEKRALREFGSVDRDDRIASLPLVANRAREDARRAREMAPGWRGMGLDHPYTCTASTP